VDDAITESNSLPSGRKSLCQFRRKPKRKAERFTDDLKETLSCKMSDSP
jgi:hypothetical protein